MNQLPPPSAPIALRGLTGVVLGLLLLALVLLGTLAVLQHQAATARDQQIAQLLAPSAGRVVGWQALDDLRGALGHQGFLAGLARFADSRDPAALIEMRLELDKADTAITRLGRLPHQPPAARAVPELREILGIYAAVLDAAERAQQDPNMLFLSDHRLPALLAQPQLQQLLSRIEAEDRAGQVTAILASAQRSNLLQWGTLGAALLLLVLGLWALLLRFGQPLRQLESSVQQLARGDWGTPVWGTERQDMVGDLARGLEQTRQALVAIPDLVVQGDSGTQKLRFGGEARSLFQLLTSQLQTAAERLSGAGDTLSHHAGRQHEEASVLLTGLRAQIQELTSAADQTQRDLSASRSQAQALGTDWIGFQARLEANFGLTLEQLQARAHGLAEIAALTGREAATALQSLLTSERNLRQVTDQGRHSLRRFARQSEEMAQQLDGAGQLLRAGGKILGEQADVTAGRLQQALAVVSNNGQRLQEVLDGVVGQLQATAPLAEEIAELSATARRRTDEFGTALATLQERNAVLGNQLQARDTEMGALLERLRDAEGQFGQTTAQLTSRADDLTTALDRLGANSSALASQQETARAALAEAAQGLLAEAQKIGAQSQAQLQQQLQALAEPLRLLTEAGNTTAARLGQALGQIDDGLTSLLAQGQRIEQGAATLEQKIWDTSAKLLRATETTLAGTQQTTQDTRQQIGALQQELGEALNKLSVLTQLTATLGNVAGQLGQVVPALAAPREGGGVDGAVLGGVLEGITTQLREREAAVAALANRIEQVGAVIEAQQAQLLPALSAQLAGQDARLSQLSNQVANHNADLVQRLEDVVARVQEPATTPDVTALSNQISHTITEASQALIRQSEDFMRRLADTAATGPELLRAAGERLNNQAEAVAARLGQLADRLEATLRLPEQDAELEQPDSLSPLARRLLAQWRGQPEPAAPPPVGVPEPAADHDALERAARRVREVADIANDLADHTAAMAGKAMRGTLTDGWTNGRGVAMTEETQRLIESISAAIQKLNNSATAIALTADAAAAGDDTHPTH